MTLKAQGTGKAAEGGGKKWEHNRREKGKGRELPNANCLT
jgi:hypothetical protein